MGEIIQENTTWVNSKDRDFEKERDANPLSFTYQSDHFIVRNWEEITIGQVIIPPSTPCEIQIRTILQHAYSELTHDTVYKSKSKTNPKILRTIARSMALIEATDAFFTETKETLYGLLESERNFLEELTEIYAGIATPELERKTNQFLIDALGTISEEVTSSSIRDFVSESDFLKDRIRENHDKRLLYRQPVILLIYYLIKHKREQLKDQFPLTHEDLRPFFTDMGEALDY